MLQCVPTVDLGVVVAQQLTCYTRLDNHTPQAMNTVTNRPRHHTKYRNDCHRVAYADLYALKYSIPS